MSPQGRQLKAGCSADGIRLHGGQEPAGHQLPAAPPSSTPLPPGQAWKGPSDLWGVLSVLSAIVVLMVPRSHTQHS